MPDSSSLIVDSQPVLVGHMVLFGILILAMKCARHARHPHLPMRLLAAQALAQVVPDQEDQDQEGRVVRVGQGVQDQAALLMVLLPMVVRTFN